MALWNVSLGCNHVVLVVGFSISSPDFEDGDFRNVWNNVGINPTRLTLHYLLTGSPEVRPRHRFVGARPATRHSNR